MKKNYILSTISIVLSAIAIIASVFGLLYVVCSTRDAIEENTATTVTVESETTTITKNEDKTILSVKDEIEKFKGYKNQLNKEANKFISIVPYLEEMSPELLDILKLSTANMELLRDKGKEELSPAAYKELQDWIENDSEWWTPIVMVTDGYKLQYSPEHKVDISYSNGKFILSEGYWRYSVWTENVEVPANNEEEETQRTYVVQDITKPAYILIESAETPLQLYIVEPNNN